MTSATMYITGIFESFRISHIMPKIKSAAIDLIINKCEVTLLDESVIYYDNVHNIKITSDIIKFNCSVLEVKYTLLFNLNYNTYIIEECDKE